MNLRMRIGGAVFDSTTGEVARNGRVTRLEPQPAALLALLASRPGELVSHAELRNALWGDATHFNFQQGLHYAIRQARLALGESAGAASVIENVPRRGYRLRAEVGPLSRSPAAAAPAGPAPRQGRWPMWIGIAAATLSTLAIVERRPNSHHDLAVSVLKAIHDLVY